MKRGSARARPAGVEIRRRDFLEGTWAPFLLHAATLRFRYPRAPAPAPAAPALRPSQWAGPSAIGSAAPLSNHPGAHLAACAT